MDTLTHPLLAAAPPAPPVRVSGKADDGPADLLWSGRRRRSAPVAVGCLVATVFLAVVARLSLIDAQSAWLDEGYTMAVARHTLGQIMIQATQFDTHPPLYYILLHLWLALLGYGVTQGRFLSLLCGVVAIPLIYMVAEDLFDRATALCAALLLAVSPIALWYSDEIRMYAMSGLFVLGAFACLVRAIRHDRRLSWWLAYASCAAAAVYTDYSAAYALVGAALASLAVVFSRRRARLRWGAAHVIVGVLALPLILTFAHQVQDNLGQLAWIPAPTPQIVEATLLDLLSQNTGPRLGLEALGLGLATLSALALYREWAQPRVRQAYLFAACIGVAPVALPLLASLSHPVFLTRTVTPALYGLLILVARGITQPARRHWPVLMLLPLLLVNARSFQAAAATTINDDWRGAASYLRGQVFTDDVLIFDPEYAQLPFDLYWQHPPVLMMQRGYDRDEGLLTQPPGTLRTAGDMVRATRGARSVWLVTPEGDPAHGALPADIVGQWLPQHMVAAGYHHTHGVTIRRFTRLPVGGAKEAGPWLDAAGIVLHAVAPDDLVVVHGAGSDTFLRAWRTYPHVAAPLIRLGATGGQPALTVSVRPRTRSIWLATGVSGYGDPAGVADDWLYQHGAPVGPVYRFGPVRVYMFTYTHGAPH